MQKSELYEQAKKDQISGKPLGLFSVKRIIPTKLHVSARLKGVKKISKKIPFRQGLEPFTSTAYSGRF